MGTLSGELQTAIIEQRKKDVRALIGLGKRVVVIGAMPGNVDPALRDHPLLDLWQSDNGLSGKQLPDATGLVLHTLFVSHGDLDRIKADAERRNIPFYPQPLTTGLLRDMLSPLAEASRLVKGAAVVATRNEPTKEGPIVSTSHPPRRGELSRFIITHANLNAPNLRIEGDRVFALAKKTGLGTTVGSVLQSMLKARHELGLPTRKSGGGRGVGRSTLPSSGNGHARVAPVPTVADTPPLIAASLRTAHDDADPMETYARDAKAAIDLMMEKYREFRTRAAGNDAVRKELAAIVARL